MKFLKKNNLEPNSRFFGIIIALIVAIVVTTHVSQAGAALSLDNYVETVDISVQDGNAQPKGYLVKQDTVDNVLTQLDYQLYGEDTVNKGLEEIVEKGDLLSITRVSRETVVEKQEIASPVTYEYSDSVAKGGTIQQGTPGEITNTYEVVYQNSKAVEKTLILSKKTVKETTTVISKGKKPITVSYLPSSQEFAAGIKSFTGILTYYGGDCAGCSGYAASGLSLSATTGVNYSNTALLQYQGGSYYCLAADPSIPFGTIVKIENHNLSLNSTIYGIVVDRGGAITGTHFDIYYGSKANPYFTGGTSYNTKFTIVSYGSGSRNFWR